MKFFVIRKYLFVFFVLCACANVNAQTDTLAVDSLSDQEIYEEQYVEDEQEEYYDYDNESVRLSLINFNLTNHVALGTFSKNVSGAKIGLSLAYFNNFSKKDDLFWSLHVATFRIDRLSNSFRVQEQFVEYDLFSKTKTSLVFFGYGVRYYPDIYTPLFEPFLDVKLGVNYIYTSTSDTIDGSEEPEVNFNNSDLSLGYAVGLGVQYNVREGHAFHFVINYHGGTSATYYINGEKGFEDPFDNFVRRTTQLDYMQFAFGVTFGF